MAVPTLSSCTPSVIFTGGQLVTLTGTNFRLPYAVLASNGILPVPPPTVAVTIDGVPAVNVQVLSATSLTCIAPAWTSGRAGDEPGAVAIKVQNLDVNGNPITLEAVTVAAAVTYQRADLSKEDNLTRVSRSLLQMLKRLVIPNVVKTVDVEFAASPGASSYDIVEIAKLPCVVVSGPSTKTNRLYEQDKRPIEAVGGSGFQSRRTLKTIDLVYKIAVYDDHDIRLGNLQGLVDKVFQSNLFLNVLRDETDVSKGFVSYEMNAGDFEETSTPNTNNVRMFSGDVTVHGFTHEDITGFPNQMVVETGQTVDNVVVQEGKFSP